MRKKAYPAMYILCNNIGLPDNYVSVGNVINSNLSRIALNLYLQEALKLAAVSNAVYEEATKPSR